MRRARDTKPLTGWSHPDLARELQVLRKGFELERLEWQDDRARLLVAQQHLEASHERYVELYDSAPVGYITLNPAGSVIGLNLTAAALLGHERQELLRRPLVTLLDPVDRRKFLDYLVKLRATPGTLTREFHFCSHKKDAILLRLVSKSSRDIRSAHGTINIVFSDVTERERAESALRESEGRFHHLADAAPVLIWVAGPDKLCTYFNRPWLQFTGRTIEQELGNGWTEGLHPDDRREFLTRYAMAFDAHREFRMECRLRRHDGEYRWMLSHGVPRVASTSELAGYLGSCVDITERRQAEVAIRRHRDELEASVRARTAELTQANATLKAEISDRRQAELARAQLAAIVESSSDAIMGEDLEGRIINWNRSAETMFGYTADEMIGRSFATLVPKARRHDYRKVCGRLMLGEVVESFETVALHKRGGRIEISLTISPVRDPAGEVAGTSTIARDISRRKRLEAEIVRISEREQQRIARDLHEGLGQQLAGISCLSNILKGNLAARGAEETVAASKISSLLDVAVAQTRDLALGLQPVPPDPGALMSVLEALAARVTEVFQVACRFQCPHPVLLHDNAMATHLYRIAQEAVTNAIRHGRAQRIEIALSSTPAEITLAVRNDGAPLKPKPRGPKGMGLKIMKYRADRMGGSLDLQPWADHGSEVICTVPATRLRRSRRPARPK